MYPFLLLFFLHHAARLCQYYSFKALRDSGQAWLYFPDNYSSEDFPPIISQGPLLYLVAE